MAQGPNYAGPAGLLGGYDALQNFLAQKKLEEQQAADRQAKAQQLNFENQIKAQEASSHELVSKAEYARATAPPPDEPLMDVRDVKDPSGRPVINLVNRKGVTVSSRPQYEKVTPQKGGGYTDLQGNYLGIGERDESGGVKIGAHVYGPTEVREAPNQPAGPGSPEQQYIAAVQSGDTTKAAALLQTIRDFAAAGRDPGAAQARADTLTERQRQDLEKSQVSTRNLIDKAEGDTTTHLQKLNEALELTVKGSEATDPLVAPKLLTALVGGPGTGVRLTQAEITNILGNQTKWEQLQNTLSHWGAPGSAKVLSPEFRQEAIDLIRATQSKVARRLAITSEANDRLLGAKSVDEHQQIYNDMKHKLNALLVDGGPAEFGADGKLHIK